MSSEISAVLFENPFHIEDLQVFDDHTLHNILVHGWFGVTLAELVQAIQGGSKAFSKRIRDLLPQELQADFTKHIHNSYSEGDIARARQHVLDKLFWELIYWKTPELYEQLTEGEHLPAGIFQCLAPDLQGKIVLDAGAGSGRASFECIRYGAQQVYAVEPSPGLLRILKRKLANQAENIMAYAGRFDDIPLVENSVDIALSCSAFSAVAGQGGESGLAELKRVTRPGGQIIIIWPRSEDQQWLEAHDFQYVELPVHSEMYVHFRSLQTALHCAHLFYGRSSKVMHYIQNLQKPEIPFSVLGLNTRCDYYWLKVDERKSSYDGRSNNKSGNQLDGDSTS